MTLRANELRDLVLPLIGIDSFKSKIGDDDDIIVLHFTVKYADPAKDLENFIEMGYNFIIDADVTPGETDAGVYLVFVELERSRDAPEQIMELIDGVKRLTGHSDMRFRYYKQFKTYDLNLENIKAAVPITPEQYIDVIDEPDNANEFFKESYVNEIELIGDSIVFARSFSEPVGFNIIDFGCRDNINQKYTGPILLESGFGETTYLTKYIGDYGIQCVDGFWLFENQNHILVLERI